MALAVFFLLSGLEFAVLSLAGLPYAGATGAVLFALCAVRLATMWPALYGRSAQPSAARRGHLYADRSPAMVRGA